MKMNKKITALIITLVLGLLTLPALGAPGDATVFDRQWRKDNISDNATMKDLVLMGDTLYALFTTRIYAYQLGAEEPALIVDFLPGKEKEYYHFFTFEEAKTQLEEGAETYIEQLFIWQDQLYGLNLLTGQAFIVDRDKGALVKENSLTLATDIKEITQSLEEQNTVERSIEGPVGDELFMTAFFYGDGPSIQKVYSFNLATGERKEYKSEFIQQLLPYKDNNLLAVVYDEQNSYDHEKDKPIYPKVMVFNPKEDSLTPYVDLPDGDLGAFAYSPKDDALIYAAKGRVYKIQPQGKEEQVGYIAKTELYYRDQGIMAGDNLYGVFTSYDKVLLKNIDPQYMNVKPLTIRGDLSEENLSFQKKYPDVPIVMAEEGQGGDSSPQPLTQMIQTGDGSIDIFIDSPSYINFKKLMEKEYAYPLSTSSIIKENVERMYPFIKEGITLNGEIYAVPTYVDLTTTISYSPDVFEKAGLTKEDVPTTYMAYLDLYMRWNKELAEKNPDIGFWSYSLPKEQIASEVLKKYADVYAKSGEMLDFDTPLFRALMAKVDEAFESVDPSTSPIGSADGEEIGQPLFIDFGDNALMVAEGYYPLILPLDEGVEGATQAHASLAFINPKSSNIDMALAFLEEITNNYPKEKQVAYYTDVKDPVPFKDFDQWVKDWEETLAENKAKLETAQGGEKKELEEYIERGEKLLENKEDRRWEISAEMIADYETMAPDFYISNENLLYAQDEDNNIYRLLDNYVQGTMTLDEFIDEANRRVQMVAIENQ